MIAAAEALQLPTALPEGGDITDCRDMLTKLDAHIRKYMTFGGPPPLTVPFRELSKTAVQLLCFAMKRFKWVVNANLMARESKIRGGQPEPDHWILQLQPMPEVYEAMLPDTLLVSSANEPPAA